MTIPSLQAQIARSVGYFSDAMSDTGNASPAYAYRKTLAASEDTLREMQSYLRVVMKEGHLSNGGDEAAATAIDALSDLIGEMQNYAE